MIPRTSQLISTLCLLLLQTACVTKDENPLNVDNDGDGWTEFDGDCDDSDPSQNLEDVDGDGYLSDLVPYGLDCDDEDPAVSPDALEICDDLADNDCDGLLDQDDEECGACAHCASNIGPVRGSSQTLPILALFFLYLTRRRRPLLAA